MTDIFDRLRTEIDQIGDRVKEAVSSSRLHLERSGLVGQRSKLAYKLGMHTYRKARGGEASETEIESLFTKLDEVSEKIADIDRQLDDLAGDSVHVDEKPAPSAETGEAEVSGGAEESESTPNAEAEGSDTGP